jgi:predicted transcriptional regulator
MGGKGSGPKPPEPAVIAKALHLRRTTSLSLKGIAEEIGVRSPSTVMNYLALAEQAETWFPHLDRREVGQRLNLVYTELLDRLLKRLDDPDAEPEKVAMAIVRVGQELARMHGLYAPLKTQEVTDDPKPDPEMTASIRAALDELEGRLTDDGT